MESFRSGNSEVERHFDDDVSDSSSLDSDADSNLHLQEMSQNGMLRACSPHSMALMYTNGVTHALVLHHMRYVAHSI